MEKTLPERQRLILKEIVDRYIRLREPVSSRMILDDYGLSVSSATVRNDMNDLEEAGYIEKPYASSGRIPTKKGYRFFVDWLIDLSELTKKERLEVVEAYEVQCLEVGETMRQTAFLLGNITEYAGFVIPPRPEETRLDRVVLVQMGPRTVLLVIVSDIGIVEHGIVSLDDDISRADVERITEIINTELHGVSLNAVRGLTLQDRSDGWYERPIRQALLVLGRLLERRSSKRLYFEGVLNLVSDLQRSVPDEAMDRFSGLIRAVQDEDAFVEEIYRKRGDRSGLVVSIGGLRREGMEDFSVITSDYRPHGGVMGVIGPIWMNYGRAMSALSYIANRLETILVSSCPRDLSEGVEK
ncbi:heat-inducible transcription repressor HrcA [Candidatus Bipolaricaulota bacterium]|nr:heat-inducible transcription repressor HrcA [Candidatus Bipolaricaulota bacterium]HHR86064.1 heat-inducible transcription repressor HrcA [Candidatus Acetothermia bacterium]